MIFEKYPTYYDYICHYHSWLSHNALFQNNFSPAQYSWFFFIFYFYFYFLQIGAVTWILAIVTMQLDLPHPAVFQGLTCRSWQAASLGLGFAMLAMLRRPPPGKPILPQVDFTAIPQGTKHL